MKKDDIIVLPSGTEISVEAALGDLARAGDFLGEFKAEDLVADLGHVGELIGFLADQQPKPYPTEGMFDDIAMSIDRLEREINAAGSQLMARDPRAIGFTGLLFSVTLARKFLEDLRFFRD